jgi:hypothetical protein
MTEWVPRFDYPASDEWLCFDVNLPDGAKEVARQIIQRGGWRNKRYAKQVYSELNQGWAGIPKLRYEPIIVYVPQVQRNLPAAVPGHVNAKRFTPDYERTLEAAMARAREPLGLQTEVSAQVSEVTAVELPAGPACRVHEVLEGDLQYGAQMTMEFVEYCVIPEVYSEDMLLFRAFWVKDDLPEMLELADRIATTLTFKPRGSGEESPRPVLDAP